MSFVNAELQSVEPIEGRNPIFIEYLIAGMQTFSIEMKRWTFAYFVKFLIWNPFWWIWNNLE